MGNTVMEQADQLSGVVAADALNLFDKWRANFFRVRVNPYQRMFGFIHLGGELFAITGPDASVPRGVALVINIGVQGAQVVRKLF